MIAKLKKEKKRTGLPPIPIDWDVVDNLLESGCSGAEAAAHFGVCPDTLYIRCNKDKNMTFSAYRAQKLAKGDSLLRSKQFSEAIKGDRTMLIWLGKQRLGQRENPGQSLENAHARLDLLLEQIKAIHADVQDV